MFKPLEWLATKAQTIEKSISRLPEYGTAGLILFGAVALVLARALARPRLMFSATDFYINIFGEIFIRSQMSQGTLAQWNPYLLSGIPALANIQSLQLYPLALVLRLLPIPLYYTLGHALHIWLAGSGMYTVARQMHVSRLSALLSGLSYMFCGFIMVRLETGHVEITYSAAWLPWAVFALMRLVSEPRRTSNIVWFAIVMTLHFLAGSPNVLIMTVFVMVILLAALAPAYLASAQRLEFGRAMLGIAGATLLTAGLTAFQFLPTAELASLSSRVGGYPAACLLRYSARLEDFTTLMFAAGPPGGAARWESTGYFGAISLIFAICAMVAKMPLRYRIWKRFLITTLLTGAVLSFGTRLPTYGILLRMVPGLSFFRVPSRSFVMIAFAGAGLAALGLETLRQAGRTSRRWPLIIGAALVCLVAAYADWQSFRDYASSILFHFSGDAFPALLVAMGQRMFEGVPIPVEQLGKLFFLRDLFYDAIRLSTPRYLVALVFLFPARNYKNVSTLWKAVLLLIVVADMWGFSQSYISLVRLESYYGKRADIPDLNIADGRVLTIPHTYANRSVYWKTGNTQALNPFIISTYQAYTSGTKYVDETCDGIGIEHVGFPLDDTRILQRLSVRYVINYGEELDLPPAQTEDSDVLVYEVSAPVSRVVWVDEVITADDNTAAIEIARKLSFVPDKQVVLEASSGIPDSHSGSSGTATIEGYAPLRIEISADAPVAGMVVLNDVWYPGWSAEVNGKPTPILRANGTFRAVAVPEGKNTIIMTYHSTYLIPGFIISGVTCFGILASFALQRRARESAGNPDQQENI